MSKEILNLASGNNFQLLIPRIPNESTVDRTLTLNLYETVLPGIAFETYDNRWQGFSLPAINSSIMFNDWTTSFNIDEKFNNWKRIFNWMIFVNNSKDKAGEKLENYAIDSTMFIYDNYGNIVIKALFTNIFPTALGDVSLSVREGEQYLTSTITFSFVYYELK